MREKRRRQKRPAVASPMTGQRGPGRVRCKWSKRPMAEREVAAQAWCDGANYAKGQDNYYVYNTYVKELFALDQPARPSAKREGKERK